MPSKCGTRTPAGTSQRSGAVHQLTKSQLEPRVCWFRMVLGQGGSQVGSYVRLVAAKLHHTTVCTFGHAVHTSNTADTVTIELPKKTVLYNP